MKLACYITLAASFLGCNSLTSRSNDDSIWTSVSGTGEPAAIEDGISVYFSPRGGATNAIIRELNEAKQSIRVQAYSFTTAPIAKALVAAHRRGVDIQVLLDSSQETQKYSSATFLDNEGVTVFVDAKHGIAHNKVMLVDENTVITGSFNFSNATEESNAENLMIIEAKDRIFDAYLLNWEDHRSVLLQSELENRAIGVRYTEGARWSPLPCRTNDAILPGFRSWRSYANI